MPALPDVPDRRGLVQRLRARPRRVALVVVLAALALVIGLVNLGPRDDHSWQGGLGPTAETSRALRSTNAPTQFRIASFNVLGYGHTAGGGNRGGWADGRQRMRWATEVIQREQLDVVGFQEFQKPQWEVFHDLAGADYGVYPGNQLTLAAMQNSIAWRKSEWQLLQAKTVLIPYFDGHRLRMPYVLLRNRETGSRAWFFNTHNPADAHGAAQRWRDEGFRIEANLINRLRAERPRVPVFSTGDKNDHEEYFCVLARRAGVVSANGGVRADGSCVPPTPMKVDWVVGTSDVRFSGYAALRDDLVAKTTDHPVVVANATVAAPEVRSSPIDRVVVVDIEGLRPPVLIHSDAEATPHLQAMRSRGASTMEARTAVERTTRLPNLVSMLTGRRVDPAAGGHGVGYTRNPATVHQAAGRYVSSIFDLVHNYGRRTALFSSTPDTSLLDDTWSGAGGVDPYGVDDGRDKIDTYVQADTDAAAVTALRDRLATRPPALTVVHLSDLDDAGHAYGWRSRGYKEQLTRTDQQLGRILGAVRHQELMAGRTLVVVTSDHGGVGTDHTDRTLRGNYRVPFLVVGPGVPAGADLYALNPTYATPGRARTSYADTPPIRNTYVANLVTTVLDLPALPGSNQDARQDFTVLSQP